jgi:hypothetical protein
MRAKPVVGFAIFRLGGFLAWPSAVFTSSTAFAVASSIFHHGLVECGGLIPA